MNIFNTIKYWIKPIFVPVLKRQLLLIILAPIILVLGWPPLTTGFLLFLGFVPLLILEYLTPKWYGLKVYLSLLLWNIGTTWWVWNASPEGCIAMLIANSLFLTLPFIIYKKTKHLFGTNFGLFAWIISWLSMEFLHLNWEIAYPWLNLGNGLATMPYIIQWYELTGTLGGTLWILALNVFIFKIYLHKNNKIGYVIAGILLIPIFISLYIYFSFTEQKTNGKNVVVVQPNIDPYEKFISDNSEKEVELFKRLAEKKVNQNTEFVLFPETGFTQTCEESQINNAETFILLKSWLGNYPNITLVSGCNTYRLFNSSNKTVTARPYTETTFYDIYNASIVMNMNGVNDIYRKSKLVPGVEKMPYTKLFSFLEKYAINLGGISGSLGQDTVARVFYSKSKVGAAPLICYESIFGEYVSGFVKNGAQVIFILTNDGWWGNTPGYKHHKLYARLRAIESRRDVVRCTNTGTSCIIDKKGQINGETPWWKPYTSSFTIYPNNHLTFYSKHGDYIGRLAACLLVIILILPILPKFIRKKILF